MWVCSISQKKKKKNVQICFSVFEGFLQSCMQIVYVVLSHCAQIFYIFLLSFSSGDYRNSSLATPKYLNNPYFYKAKYKIDTQLMFQHQTLWILFHQPDLKARDIAFNDCCTPEAAPVLTGRASSVCTCQSWLPQHWHHCHACASRFQLFIYLFICGE